MKLYASPQSGSSRKVHLFCEEAKIPYQYCMIDLSKGAHHEPGFLALNPNGQVPVIDDGGFVLWESQAILRYLANKHKTTSWYPSDIKPRALVDQWLDWNTSRLTPESTKLLMNIYFGGDKKNERVISEVQQALHKILPILDRALAKNEFVIGPDPTLADLGILPSILYLEQCRQNLLAYKGIVRWYAAMKNRPSFKATAAK